MKKEEIRNKLYNIADRIKENADKYVEGTLRKTDWTDISENFSTIINYIANPSYEPAELQEMWGAINNQEHEN